MTDRYFQKALSDFTFEAACGGAIRHLAGLGYTARQITDQLSFSVPYERVRRAYTKYLLEQKILLMQEPSAPKAAVKVTYVQEFGKYGKPSFRRVEEEEAGSAERIYVPCRFGISQELFLRQLAVLEPAQKEYLQGICWEPKVMYHLLNERMEEIMKRLDAKKLGGSF